MEEEKPAEQVKQIGITNLSYIRKENKKAKAELDKAITEIWGVIGNKTSK